MKIFFLLTFSFTIAFAPVASAEDKDEVKAPKSRSQATQNTRRMAPHVAPRRNTISQAPRFQRSATVRQQTPIYRAPRLNPVTTNRSPRVRSFVDRDTVRANRLNRNPRFTPRVRTNPRVVTTPQTTTTVQSDVNARNRFDRGDRNRTDRNWRNRTSNNNSWEHARRRHHRNHHHRNWWRSHYTRFALFGSGYYFWDNNYWYPAYGYDSAYNTYAYDEPIYGYNDLDPAQVIANVQTELQRLGYYRYAVDGQMGPMTRAAIANYQRDNGLAITSAIDGPTLGSLGLG